MVLNAKQQELCESSRWDFSDLKGLFLNCTLKRSPERSHTQGLIDVSMGIMEKNGLSVDVLRPVDYQIAYGVWPDMTEHGWDRDDWPKILEKVMSADILVIGSSIWLGEKTSVCTQTIEHLYAASHLLNAVGQYAYYGRVGGCLITQIPPQAFNLGWIRDPISRLGQVRHRILQQIVVVERMNVTAGDVRLEVRHLIHHRHEMTFHGGVVVLPPTIGIHRVADPGEGEASVIRHVRVVAIRGKESEATLCVGQAGNRQDECRRREDERGAVTGGRRWGDTEHVKPEPSYR